MFKIDIKSSKPIYEQIIEEIKTSVVKGYLKEGDAVPSVRKLSLMMEINPNTVSKAYHELERQGVIITLRGKGTFISSKIIKNYELETEAVMKKLKPLIVEMKFMGLSEEEIIEKIRNILDEIREEK